jgi:DNA-binding NarL/FixJ family response regulator
VRAVIADDHALLREGLVAVLTAAGFEVAGAVSNAEDLLDRVAVEQPELVVTDIRMPPSYTDEGLVAALQIKKDLPDTAVLVLSQFVQWRYAVDLIEQHAGGCGYLLKQRIGDIATFRCDVHRICAGGTVLDPEVVTSMVARADSPAGTLDPLTARQKEVLSLMATGRSNSSIAHLLSISEKAVVQHASHIYDVLGLPVSPDDHRRVLAVLQYLNR